MTARPVVEHPDPRLRLASEPVTLFDAGVGRLIDDLADTLAGSPALGLSAPQIDDRRQVLILASPDGEAPRAFVNPQILARRGWGLVEESCLSVPGFVANVARATQLRVRAQDRRGETFERDLVGMDAVCLQHEMDHLAGTLFIDRLSRLERLRLRLFAGTRVPDGSRAA